MTYNIQEREVLIINGQAGIKFGVYAPQDGSNVRKGTGWYPLPGRKNAPHVKDATLVDSWLDDMDRQSMEEID